MTFLPDSWLSPAVQTQLIGKDMASRLTMTRQPSLLEFVASGKKPPDCEKHDSLVWWNGDCPYVNASCPEDTRHCSSPALYPPYRAAWTSSQRHTVGVGKCNGAKIY